MSLSLRTACTCLAWLVAVSAVAAQPSSVSGTVTDPQRRPVAGAQVLLEGPAAIVRETRSDTTGRFRFDSVTAGTYRLRAVMDGFTHDPVTLDLDSAAGPREVDLALRIAAFTDHIVVSAAGVEAPVSTVGASTTVLSEADLRVAQAEIVSDALRRVPGMTVVASGGRGAVTSWFPRGGESDYTLVMLDGLRLNSFGGGFDAAHLPVTGTERVEVIRGPQSALFGADAIGGVVQVIPRRTGPFTADLLGEAGSQDTGRATAGLSGRLGLLSWHASGRYVESQGRNGERTGRGETVVNDDYTARTLTAGAGWEHGGGQVRGTVHLNTSIRGNPGPFGSDPNGTSSGIDAIARGGIDHLGGAVALLQRIGPAVRVRADASSADLESRFRGRFGSSSFESRRHTGRAQADWVPGRAWSVSAGTELLAERARSTFIVGAARTPVPVRRRVWGSFAEARYSHGRRLTAAAGVRAERIRRAALEGDPAPFTNRPPFAADTVVSWNPKISVSWAIRPTEAGGIPATRLRANAGTGIRAPDAFELAFTDNPGLKPERSRSFDLGLEHLLAGGRVSLDATWFVNRYDDLIVAVGRAFTGVSRYRTDNISNARARGLELGATARPGTAWQVRAGYTWLDTGILAVDRSSIAPPPFTAGQPLLRRPRHQGFAEVTWTSARVDAFARVAMRGKALDVDPSFGTFGGLVTAPGYETADIGVTWRPFARAPHAVLLRVTNLFDRQYEEALGFPAPPRAVMVGVRLAHRR